MLSWNMDEASRNLILQLLTQDALEESNRHKGKQRAGVFTDGELAVQEWSGQLNQSSIFIQDHQMALSMANAVSEDGVALTLAAQEEDRAFADRSFAFKLAGKTPPANEQPSVHEQPLRLIDTVLSEGFASQIDAQDEFLRENYPNKRRCVAESSKAAESRQCIAGMQAECAACNDKKPAYDMIQAPCSHSFCNDCIIHLVKDALKDQSLFPPRCCRIPIPPPALKKHLDAELVRSFEAKEIENNDPYRTYCSNAHCAKYIPPPRVDGYVGICHTCRARTCTLCKRLAHGGPCIDEDNEIMELAKRSGWQQCPHCHHLIELNTGCNHITCRCRYEFCYLCTAKWKTCGCARWDEDRLYDRARVVAARNAERPPAQEDVREVVERIRGAPCQYQHAVVWRRIEAPEGDDEDEDSDDEDSDDDGFECDICGDVLPDFILECPNCEVRACLRCKQYRL